MDEMCGYTEEHGGDYEWICVKPPHNERDSSLGHNQQHVTVGNHYFIAKLKVA